jgi:hypothetical protein
MSAREQISSERLYRYVSISLAVVTGLMLVPASWIPLPLPEREKLEPKPRPVEIVRLPPETLPPPPPLPPRPKPKPRREPEPERRPQPEPEQEIVRLQPMIPEIEIPRERQQQKQLDLAVNRTEQMRLDQATPDVEVPRERREDRRSLDVVAETRSEQLRRDQQVEVTVPKNVPRTQATQRVEVAAATTESYVDTEAPDVDVVTPRPATREAARPSPLPPSQQLRTGVAVRADAEAPAVDVPRGNTSRPQRAAPVAVSGAVTGTRVVYDADPGAAAEVAVASPKAARRGGSAPRLAVTEGGASGVQYSSAPEGTAVGPSGGGQRSAAASARIDRIRERLARKYGLPLVSVNDLGQRSTEAARWNLLLPELSDLLRRARRLQQLGPVSDKSVVAVEKDGESLVIRYRDGVVHVLVTTDSGLATLLVGRAEGARPVKSKVQEAESARNVLYRITRGAS